MFFKRKKSGDEASTRLKENPRDVLALIESAEAAMARRDAESALRDIERGLQIVLLERRLKAELRSSLLAALYTLKSRALVGKGDWAMAWKAVEQALGARPDDPGALVQRGRIRRDSGDLQGALKDLGHAIELDASSPGAYLARGMTWYELRNYQQALADYDRALELDRTSGVVWSNRGRAHLALNDLRQAEKDFHAAIRLEPSLIAAYDDLASIAWQQGRPDEALRVLVDGLKQHPDHPRLLVRMARIYIDQDRLSEARSALDAALCKAPDYAEALALRGQLKGRSGDLAAAQADLSQALELNPHDPETLFNYALTCGHMGNLGDALQAIRRMLQLTPDDAEAWAWRGRLARQLGLETLDRVASVLERFAYSHCGPGLEWRVELRQMHRFLPGGEVESFDAAVLDLCQTPAALLQVMASSSTYTVTILTEKLLPKVSHPCWSEGLTRTVPAQPDALLELLDGFISAGVLTVGGNGKTLKVSETFRVSE